MSEANARTEDLGSEVLNEGTGTEAVAGKIALQSEGAEIHFRNIRLIPIQRGAAQ